MPLCSACVVRRLTYSFAMVECCLFLFVYIWSKPANITFA